MPQINRLSGYVKSERAVFCSKTIRQKGCGSNNIHSKNSSSEHRWHQNIYGAKISLVQGNVARLQRKRKNSMKIME